MAYNLTLCFIASACRIVWWLHSVLLVEMGAGKHVKFTAPMVAVFPIVCESTSHTPWMQWLLVA